MGVIRNVQVPEGNPNEGAQLINLPDWSPGSTISGTVIKTDGKPFANTRLMISSPGFEGYSDGMRFKTDSQGKFSIKGLLPGSLFIWTDGSEGGWSVEVPDKGTANVVLRMTSQPVRIQFYDGGERPQLWWFPDGGKARRLPTRWSQCCAQDIQPGAGSLWCFEGSTGRSFYKRCTLLPGNNNIAGALFPNAEKGPSLGIYFPLDLAAGLPGVVRLIGQGERAGLSVAITNLNWAPSAPLGLITGQIDAVPPGTYKIAVDTTRGVVESTVTITEKGGVVKLSFPPAKEKPTEEGDAE